MSMELNKIYIENCLETMARMPDGFLNLVVTSPPYDNLRSYNGYSFDFEAVAKELFRVVKPGGVVVWVVGDATIEGNETGTSFRQALYFKEIGFCLYDTMIYQKMGQPTPQKPEIRYAPVFEYMFVFCKGVRPSSVNLILQENKHRAGVKKNWSKMQRGGEVLKYTGITRDSGVLPNVWLIDSVNETTESRKHPAPFPEVLAKRHIYTWSNDGDIVYDPFMGSGTTAKMAHLQNRQWIGSEISAEYVALAEKRLQPYLTQGSLFTSDSCV